MKKTIKYLCAIGIISILCSCATIPREVVTLSYTMGEDLSAVHASYNTLIHHYFDSLRDRVNDYIDHDWKPAYLKSFIEKGNLTELASDENPDKVLADISLWTEIAVNAIEKQRQKLLAPVDDDETALTESVNKAFNQLYHANAVITAHLNSLKKVKEQENLVLSAFKLESMQKEITAALDAASREVEAMIQKVDTAKHKIGQ